MLKRQCEVSHDLMHIQCANMQTGMWRKEGKVRLLAEHVVTWFSHVCFLYSNIYGYTSMSIKENCNNFLKLFAILTDKIWK